MKISNVVFQDRIHLQVMLHDNRSTLNFDENLSVMLKKCDHLQYNLEGIQTIEQKSHTETK